MPAPAEPEQAEEIPQPQPKVEQPVVVGHQDEGCPHIETIAQLKGQIKRLRQELILKGPSKKKTD